MNLGDGRSVPTALLPHDARASSSDRGVQDDAASGLFNSFWMGGFEGADHVNGLGHPLDMSAANAHAAQFDADYARAADLGIRTVRESIGWRICEREPGAFDLARVRSAAASARRHGVQVIWTLMHYGTPPDVSLLDDRTVERFVHFAVAVAKEIGDAGAGQSAPIYNLINEIGFLAWAVSETNLIHPYRSDRANPGGASGISGHDVKLRLVRASLAATAAIAAIDPRARFLQVEPLVHVVAPKGRPELTARAAEVDGYQWQVWDMLAGHTEVALQGLTPALDLIGVNHYHAGQWEVDTGATLDWHSRDPRRRPFGHQLLDVWRRYQRPLVVTETSHVGEGRARWLNDISNEVRRVREQGVPVEGICLYPLVDRPDWSDATHWHHSGLWDVDWLSASTPMRRVLCTDYADALQRWQQTLPIDQQRGRKMQTLIVFSHLRWSFVYQRPQHLMSRLAGRYRVVFIEEPVHTDDAPWLERMAHGPHLDVLVPHTSVAAPGFHDDQLAALETLLSAFMEAGQIQDPLLWFYTPMALPLMAATDPGAVIFDCMDQLSAFKFAPRQLRQREAALMKAADLVLTGGPALYETRRHLHSNIHCLPSAVDAAHYAPSNLDAGSAHAQYAIRLQPPTSRPRLGFFGVIDERFDIQLLRSLALAHPEWELVMVGPVLKIDAADLPSESNIRWLGMQPYERLPYLMAAWDVCLMPFALNESTRFISPTKTLEYMAGEKPVVSTPVGDVIALYGDTVRIAPAGPAFVMACEQALAEGGSRRQQRQDAMRATVQRSSWDRAADTVHELIQQAVRESRALADAAAVTADAQRALASQPASDSPLPATLSVVRAAAGA